MNNTFVGTAPSLPWCKGFLCSETAQGQPFRRKMERDGHACLDSETTFGGWNPVLTEQSMAFEALISQRQGPLGPTLPLVPLWPRASWASPRHSPRWCLSPTGNSAHPSGICSLGCGHMVDGWGEGLSLTRRPAAFSVSSFLSCLCSFLSFSHVGKAKNSPFRSITDWNEAECVSATWSQPGLHEFCEMFPFTWGAQNNLMLNQPNPHPHGWRWNSKVDRIIPLGCLFLD